MVEKCSREVQELLASPTHSASTLLIRLVDQPAPENVSRSQKISHRKGQFEAVSQEVENAIRRMDGQILDRVWLNHTLLVRMPIPKIFALEQLQQVARIELPQTLHKEQY